MLCGLALSLLMHVLQNYMRVVEVWLDPEHREYFYTREPTIRGYPVGDISAQLAFKEKHKCRSFKWFLDNIAYEVVEKFPPPPPNLAWGEVSVFSQLFSLHDPLKEKGVEVYGHLTL